MDKLKFIKIVVFILTFLIIFGLFYAITIIHKNFSASPSQVNINLDLPQGSYIKSYQTDDKNLYILIKESKFSDQLIAIDKKTQKILLSIKTSQENYDGKQ